MFTTKVEYDDYRGVHKERELFFHFNEAELNEMTFSIDGGLDLMIKKIVEAQSQPGMIKIFKKLLLLAYGEISDDGDRFVKSEELRTKFEQSPAYSIMFMRLANDDQFAADFINGILPESMRASLAQLDTEDLNEDEKKAIEMMTVNRSDA